MRQSMLEFGQRTPAAPKSTAAPQARASQGTAGDGGGGNTTSAVASSSKHKVATSNFFSKRERKQGGRLEVVEAVATQSTKDDVPRPPQKRRLESQAAPPRRQRSVIPDAPWPGRDNIHVQPDASTHAISTESAGSLRLPRLKRERGSSQEDTEVVWPWSHCNAGNDTARVEPVRRSKETAGCSLLSHEKSASANEKHAALWTDRSRPRSASALLGNERKAVYLRDWLHALQVSGASGSGGMTANGTKSGDASHQPRPVTKRAQKRRGRPALPKEMDDFIIGDDEEEEAWFDQFRKAGSPPSVGENGETSVEGVIDGENLDFSQTTRLTNIIVLVGPSGCGKTASVYACAHELGFEVFELFPGMGKRSGKDITSVVGDVGRNHMVASGGTGGGASSKLTGFFKLAQSAPLAAAQSGTAPGTVSKPRQSLVLFEETDVLYEDDKGFWPALIELVSDSRRPIVLTCNDLSTVPLKDLPVQCVLRFVAPSMDVAAPYLQSVAAQEGYSLPLDFVADIYTNHVGTNEDLRRDEELLLSDNGPLHPNLSINLNGARLDLRQSLMQLQFMCQQLDIFDACPSADQAYASITLRACIAKAEARSYADAFFVRPHSRAIEELDEDNRKATLDDVQVSSSWMRKPLLRGDEVALPVVGQEDAFKGALCWAAHTQLDTMKEAITYHHDRLACSRAIDHVAENLSVACQSRVPSHEAVLDYVALALRMVELDDAEEAAHQARVSQQLDEARQLQSGRRTAAWSEASAGLASIGIRSSRQSSRLLLQRDLDGKMQLGLRESAFSRWLLLDDASLTLARTLSLHWTDGA